MTVHLSEIIDAIDDQIDEYVSYLDLDTGEVHSIALDLLREAEEPGDEEPDLPDWEKPE